MFAASLLIWWYSAGWLKQVQLIKQSLFGTADLFSIGILLKTLFAPFRQISASSQINDTFGDKIRAAFDKLFSRIVGTIMRTIMIFIGIIVLLLQVLFSGFRLMIWPLIPLTPLIGLMLTLLNWVPPWV